MNRSGLHSVCLSHSLHDYFHFFLCDRFAWTFSWRSVIRSEYIIFLYECSVCNLPLLVQVHCESFLVDLICLTEFQIFSICELNVHSMLSVWLMILSDLRDSLCPHLEEELSHDSSSRNCEAPLFPFFNSDLCESYVIFFHYDIELPCSILSFSAYSLDL